MTTTSSATVMSAAERKAAREYETVASIGELQCELARIAKDPASAGQPKKHVMDKIESLLNLLEQPGTPELLCAWFGVSDEVEGEKESLLATMREICASARKAIKAMPAKQMARKASAEKKMK